MDIFQAGQPTPQPVSQGEFKALAKRVANLEHSVKMLSTPPMVDQARMPYALADSVGDRYYHRYGDLSGTLGQIMPWISTTTRFSEQLTSIEFLKVTVGQAAIMGLSFAGLGGLASWGLELPALPTIIVSGSVGFIGTVAVLILVNRLEIHSLVKGQADKSKRRSELRVQIDQPGDHGIEFLYLNSDIKPEQLKEFARAALDGAVLSVHKWTGKGALFTRGQFDDLMGEFEKMNYIIPARGNVGRCLNAKGRALMRGLIE